MVELEGTELTTPHPVVEPLSDLRVRNGIFRCRDGRAKTEFSSPGDRYLYGEFEIALVERRRLKE